jgi:hypothetical protein
MFAMRSRAGVMALAILGVAGWASAATITQNASISSTQTDWINDQQGLTFQKFNVAGATLTKVTLSVDTSVDSSVVTATNNSDIDITASAYTQVDMTVTAANNQTLLRRTASDTFNFGILAPHTSADSNVLSGTDNLSGSWTDSATLDAYQGTGNITIPVNTLTHIWSDFAGGNGSVSQVTFASAGATLTYEYTMVPEPAIGGALACGAVSVLGFRKRTKA